MSEAELINLLNAKIRRLRSALTRSRYLCGQIAIALALERADRHPQKVRDFLEEVERIAAEALEP